MVHFNADVLVLFLIAAVLWSYSRWLVTTEHARYRRRHHR